MNAGVMGMNASPFDMILGFGAQNIPQVSSGTGDFGKFMKLFPQFQGMSQVLAGTGEVSLPEVMTVLPQDVSAKETPMLLPEGLAEKLGLQTESNPEQSVQPMAMAGAEQVLTIPVKLAVAVDENNQQQLFLKVPTEVADGINPMQLTQVDGADSEEEMLIPMQLRTVEQDGQRIIADALLQTATGENVPVRLKLDVAGQINKQGVEDALINTKTESPQAMPQRQNDLVTLLGNLGVKSLVVETLDESASQPAQQLLPKAAGVKPQGLTDLSMQGMTGQADGLEGADNQTQKVTAFGQSSNQDSLTGRDSAFGQAKLDDLMARANQTATENVAISTADAAAAESANVSHDTKATTMSSTQMRYYNIDMGLDQLKQNPGQKIQVQLSPASLGKLDLSIVNHRGFVTVHLATESTQAKQAVERNLGQLESHLSSSGIKVDAFHVTVHDANRPGSYSGHQFNQQGFFGDRHQGQNFRRYNQQVKQGFNMTNENFENVMVNYLA